MAKINKIKHKGKKRTINLTVHKNHTFITKNGIPTHNCDHMSPQAQKILRGVMERYADICRFILTANYPNKILPALHSRCQSFKFDGLDQTEFTCRVGQILAEKEIDFDLETLDKFVRATYPDLRKCINSVQQNAINGTLKAPESSNNTSDYMVRMVDLFKQGKYSEGRKVVTENARPEEYPEIFRFFYDNLDLWGDTEEKQNEAILTIAKRLRDHALVADPEINLSACLIELSKISHN